ncbi:tyrosine-type recombinase/integrase [Peribacillus frigoritolerans]|uniref:tyrosine-type recombinase/integrase n=1 Tax=Peribacillus frigoritolerans TaxID=450367 RepID=UPI003D005730
MLIEMVQKDFLAERRYEKLTDNSLQSYTNLFKLFNEWLSQKGIERIEELSPRVTKEFLIWCQEERKNKPKTINSKLKLLRALAKWMIDEQMIEEPFTKNVKLQREDDAPKILDEKDLQDVLRYLRRVRRREDTFTSRRNYSLILFMAGTGTRLSEVCSLTWRDIDLDSSLITIRTSKSRKAQSIPLSNVLRSELMDYQDFLQRKLGRVPESLFVTREGNPLQKDSIQNIFKRLRAKLGLQGYFSPHTLRNHFIKGLLRGGLNLREAQLLARHSKIEVTKQYVGYYQHELKDALDESNPLRGLL